MANLCMQSCQATRAARPTRVSPGALQLGSPNMLAKTALTAGAVVVAGVCGWWCIAVDDLSGDGAGGAKKRRASAAPAETPCAGSSASSEVSGEPVLAGEDEEA